MATKKTPVKETTKKKTAKPAAEPKPKAAAAKPAKAAKPAVKAAAKPAKAAAAKKPAVKAPAVKTAKPAAKKVAPAKKAAAPKAAAAKKVAPPKTAKPAVKKAAPKKAVATAKAPAAAKAKAPAKRRAPAVKAKAVPDTIRPEAEITPPSPTAVREHFFQEHHAPAIQPPSRDVPAEYGDTRLVLLVRDPEWIFAFWEINEATRAEMQIPRGGHDRRMVLRFYKTDGRSWPEEPAHYTFDVDVGPYANNWYIKMPEPDSEWCAEVGTFDDDGNYISIVRSNRITMPRDSISEETDSQWMTVEETYRKLYGMGGGVAAIRESRGSEEILRMLSKQVSGALKGGAPTSGSMFSGGSGAITAPPPPRKTFWLVAETELILYGATEPTATLTINSQPVKLNSDGTFSLRCALPEGDFRFRVHAVNQDGDEEREIVPVVTRRTE